MQPGFSSQCALCERLVPPNLLTLHHLTPKQKGGGPEHRVAMCKPCHKQIHATFDNAELARNYGSIDSLRASPLLHPFLKWIVRQKPDRTFATVVADRHPQARRLRRR